MRRVALAVVAMAACTGSEAALPAMPARAPATPAVTAAASGAKPTAHVEGHGVRPHREEVVVECPVKLPQNGDDEARAAALLEAANKQLGASAYAAAWTCADRAADLSPASVEAHHLRGAALAGMGRDADAQLAYSLALALDPDDIETLRAVADFYINGKGDRGRDALRLGLELAQRGSRRMAVARRRRNPPLAADLAVLEAQALNDLGRSDEALTRIDAALKLAPGRGDALHEKGVALFDLSRFSEAKATLARALAIQPDDAYSHQMMGLTLEQLGEQPAADRELSRAVELAPSDLSPAVLVTVAEFKKEIADVLAGLPAERHAKLRGVPIEVVDLPDRADLTAVSPPFPPTILGLYRGPVGHGPHVAQIAEGETPSIVLYRKNLARAVKTRAELSEQIRDTLLHEIGHLEGLDEDDLRRRGME
ncbi:MAG: metallopeptidase family protein [Deltaproteobacteria bacterium]|nr:metallopeptidase family protein [Deltaproteobacteria bacterium]